jgi:hypothetical protein
LRENRALRKLFGAKRYKVRGDWRKLYNEELNNLYCSPNIVRAIRLAGYVARMGERRGAYRVWVGNWIELGVDGRIILKMGVAWGSCG